MQPVTRYAKSGDVHIAYQVFGQGPLNLVFAPRFVSNIEVMWDSPLISRWLLRLASYARVAVFDKRGTGMSDKVSELPGLDQRMDDLRVVMDAAGMEQAALLGVSKGGPLCALFAATYPKRCSALVLYRSFARFASWFPTEEALAAFLGYIDQAWGSGGTLPLFAPSVANDPFAQQWMGRFERPGPPLTLERLFITSPKGSWTSGRVALAPEADILLQGNICRAGFEASAARVQNHGAMTDSNG
jgi:pimeloyl-ACP methyl ester carboxylesterase